MSFPSRNRSASITCTWIPQIPPPPKTSPPPPKKNRRRHRRRQKLPGQIRPAFLRTFLRLRNNCERDSATDHAAVQIGTHPAYIFSEVYRLFRKGSHPAGVNGLSRPFSSSSSTSRSRVIFPIAARPTP